MAAEQLFISPWETVDTGHRSMLDHVLDRARKLWEQGMVQHDAHMCEVAERYLDIELVLQFSDGTTRNYGLAWIPF